MPIESVRYVPRPPKCKKPYGWSTMRGGCRFHPGHGGDCKPAKRRQDWQP